MSCTLIYLVSIRTGCMKYYYEDCPARDLVNCNRFTFQPEVVVHLR
jgi:hypothetical protein